jgi:hypothetical protein
VLQQVELFLSEILSSLINSSCGTFLLQTKIMDATSSSQRPTNNQKSPEISSVTDIEMLPQGCGSTLRFEVEVIMDGDGSKLPRVDGGKDAWLFLVGCFVFEALVWGKLF